MPIQILMPALSPTMTEGNLAKWLKKEGDKIKAGDVIAEIETDKATMEVEAVDEGTLGKIVVASGTQGVKVNDVIGLILEEGESKDALAGAGAKSTPQPGCCTCSIPTCGQTYCRACIGARRCGAGGRERQRPRPGRTHRRQSARQAHGPAGWHRSRPDHRQRPPWPHRQSRYRQRPGAWRSCRDTGRTPAGGTGRRCGCGRPDAPSRRASFHDAQGDRQAPHGVKTDRSAFLPDGRLRDRRAAQGPRGAQCRST